MAKDAYYFSHDSNARNDDKLIKVRMKYGAEGYGVYFMILERLMESTDYIHVKDYNTIAFDLRVDSSIVKAIIEDFGLFAFAENSKCFYSESFKRRMQPLDNIREQRRQAGIKSAEKRAKTKNDSTTVERPLPKKPTKESKVKESKENTSKEKLSKEIKKKVVDLGVLELEVKKAEQTKKLDAAKAATLERRKEFYNSLIPYVERYGKEMIRNFFNYWSELNRSSTKMNFELQKTWEVGLRLAKWASNDLKYKSNENPRNSAISDSKRREVETDREIAEYIASAFGEGEASY